MRNRCLLAIGLLLMVSTLRAEPQDAQTIGDVRCVVVGIRVSAAPDAAQHSAGLMLSLYYIGRLDGRAPTLNIEDLIIQQITTMTGADFSSEAKRCGASLTAKGQEITHIGKDIIDRGKQTSDKSAPPTG